MRGARKEERDKTENRERGREGERREERDKGKGEQTLDRTRGIDEGIPTETGQRRRGGESREKVRTRGIERRQVRGESREKVPRDYLRKGTEKVAKVVSHVNEVAEQKTDRSDRLQQTNLTSQLLRPAVRVLATAHPLLLACVYIPAAVVWRRLVRDDEAGAACILVVHWPPREHPSPTFSSVRLPQM